MTEPFHSYHARRALDRDLRIPALDAPAVTTRLRRGPSRAPGLRANLALGAVAGLALLIERIFA